MKKFYVNVQGGTGLNMALASFIAYMKENGDDNGNKDYEFYVSSPYFDLYEASPYVDGVYKPQELRDMIYDCEANDGTLVLHRLYNMDQFVKKQITYAEAWAKLMGIPFTDDKTGSKVKAVFEPYKAYPALKKQVDDIKRIVKDNGFKDYAIMQFSGGQSPLVQVPVGQDGKPDWGRVPYDYDNEPLRRHYPIDKAQKFVELYHEANPKTAIIMYQLPNEPSPDAPYVVKATIPYMSYYELSKEAKEVVCIDSSLQHLVAGVAKTTVIWGHSSNDSNKSKEQTYLPFGYSYNKNVIQPCRRKDILFFTALGPSGAKITYIEPEELIDIVTNEEPGIYEKVDGEYVANVK